MRGIDAHCDVLSKMLLNPDIKFDDHHELDVTFDRLQQADIGLQLMAIYLPEKLNANFDYILRSVELFRTKIVNYRRMHWVKSAKDLREVIDGKQYGAMLTLEGVDGLEGNFTYLHVLYYLGVRCIGITWNHANWAADGVMEGRQGGFTAKGKRLVSHCNALGIILDVSHLTDTGFMELSSLTTKPFIASHSNVRSICPHPRNLSDEQIQTIICMNGRIGLTFVPKFVREDGQAQIADLLPHIERICELGGVNHLGFGSDFDGIDRWITGLEHPGKYMNLYALLSKYYTEDEVEGFIGRNWRDFFLEHLPTDC